MGLLKKIKRTVRKVVPKEVSGILQVAAPFVSAQFGLPAGLATSLAGQLRSGRGRINPFSTLAAVAPSQAFRDFTKSSVPGGQALDQFLYGTPATIAEADVPIAATQGIFGTGEKFGLKEFVGSKLLSPDKTLSKPRLAALAAAGISLATATKEI